MISPFGFATRPRMPAIWAHLHHVPARPGVAPSCRPGWSSEKLASIALPEPRRGRLGPDLDQLLAPLLLGDQTPRRYCRSILTARSFRTGARISALFGRRARRRRWTTVTPGPGRPVEAGRSFSCVQAVCATLDLGVALGQVVDDLAEFLLGDVVVDEAVVLGQQLVEQQRPSDVSIRTGAIGSQPSGATQAQLAGRCRWTASPTRACERGPAGSGRRDRTPSAPRPAS